MLQERSSAKHANIYEDGTLLNQYLLFHYGEEKELCPFSFGPINSLYFPVKCITEGIDVNSLPPKAKAIDLGCAVGRSTFELSRYCHRVLGIDNSSNFIQAAQHIQKYGELEYTICKEGNDQVRLLAKRPSEIDPRKVSFECASAMDDHLGMNLYDVVFAGNLLCRLYDPESFLKKLHRLSAPGGQLILATPYSWSTTFTPKENWLCNTGRGSSLDCIKSILEDKFYFVRTFDLPFLIRIHLRKYEWCVSQVHLWKRKGSKENT